MIEQNFQQTKEAIKDFFEKAGFAVEVDITSGEEKTIFVGITTENPKVLIGQNGQTLADIQHLLKILASRKTDDQLYIDLDINNYKKKKMAYIRESVREWANDVALNGTSKELPPMPSFERRVVHMELAGRSDVITESAGQGNDRHVIIKPSQ